MSARELTGTVVRSLWRGFYQAGSRQGSRTGTDPHRLKVGHVRTIEGQTPGSGRGRTGCGEGTGRQRRTSASPYKAPWIPPPSSTFSTARKFLIDSVLKRITNSQAASLRRRAVQQLTSQGNSAPFLALVGVSLASGSGIITKEDEIEQLCFEIKQAVSKTSLLRHTEAREGEGQHVWCLQDFHIGKPIAKGCAAVVYSARLKEGDKEGDREGEGEEGEKMHEEEDFPLAIKMMFNYHAESNAFTILRAMHRETVPAQSTSIPSDMDSLCQMLDCDKASVKAHPNIVEMVTVFTDKVPALPGDVSLYGDALPTRLNPQGFGRNMSLFLVMKKYDMSLGNYLELYREQMSARTSLVLFTQLLEGVAFLVYSGVAHRDLKVDNLLLSLSGGPQFPQLVITDFGCCLADTKNGLRLPYHTLDTDKGGNTTLMAPEVLMAKPGPFSWINYERADLWTAATLAYQIFGGDNPFYSSHETDSQRLNSRTYSLSQLPSMPPCTPLLIKQLVLSMLSRESGVRPSPRLAATICQLLLWAPSTWYRQGQGGVPDTQDILQWLLTMTTKVVCESRWGNTAGAQFEYTLVATFLATLSLRDIRRALAWIQENNEDRCDG